MEFRVQVNTNSYGYVTVEADNAKEAYSKTKELVLKSNYDHYNNISNNDINLSNIADPVYEIEDSCIILDSNNILYHKDGLTYKNYLELLEEDFEKSSEDNIFIWGIKSPDDLSNNEESNESTMNDIEIFYNKNTKQYSLDIEEIYEFEDGEKGRINYISNLIDKFREYLIKEKNISEEDLNSYENFSSIKYYPTYTLKDICTLEAPTLLDLYLKFKFNLEVYELLMKKIGRI